MTVPATYNLNYYRGDTMNFTVVPKDQDGNGIDLFGWTPVFTIADQRGPTPPFSLVADAVIPATNDRIDCTLSPADGLTLSSAILYVYDVEVNFTGPDTVYTYITGTLTVTEDVSNA